MLGEAFRYWALSFFDKSVEIATLSFETPKPSDFIVFLLSQKSELHQALRWNIIQEEAIAVIPTTSSPLFREEVESHFSHTITLNDSIATLCSLLNIETPFVVREHFLLTKREEQVLSLIAQSLSSKEISLKLGISVHTVVAYRRSLYLKTGARTPQQLALYALLY